MAGFKGLNVRNTESKEGSLEHILNLNEESRYLSLYWTKLPQSFQPSMFSQKEVQVPWKESKVADGEQWKKIYWIFWFPYTLKASYSCVGTSSYLQFGSKTLKYELYCVELRYLHILVSDCLTVMWDQKLPSKRPKLEKIRLPSSDYKCK